MRDNPVFNSLALLRKARDYENWLVSQAGIITLYMVGYDRVPFYHSYRGPTNSNFKVVARLKYAVASIWAQTTLPILVLRLVRR